MEQAPGAKIYDFNEYRRHNTLFARATGIPGDYTQEQIDAMNDDQATRVLLHGEDLDPDELTSTGQLISFPSSIEPPHDASPDDTSDPPDTSA